MDPKLLPKMILAILITDAIVVGCIVGTLASPMKGVYVGLGAIALPFVIVPPILWWIGKLTRWHVLAERYPRTEPAPDADGGKLTSIGMRSPAMNMNNCVVWHTDDLHLHLSMVWPFGKFSRPMSIPWGVVEEIEDAKFGRKMFSVDGIRVWVPEQVVRREIAVREAMAQEGVEATEE